MHVALVASLVAPIRRAEANGPHSVIADLAHGLMERGHRVTIYAAEGSVVDGLTINEVAVGPAAGEAAIRADGRTSAEGREALRDGFVRLYSQLRRDGPDVVTQHAFDAPAIELAADLPVLHTLHLPPVSEDVVAAAKSTTAPLATVSDAARRMWQRAGVGDLSVLPNGVPRHPLEDRPILPIALVAGRISPEKGTDVAIRVARRAGLQPLVVGDVYDDVYFASHVEPLLEPGEFIGPVPRTELSRLMARSAVLLMPVRWDEAFGLVAAEAQMAGCPVVAYRRGGLAEVVPDGIGGYLVEPEDDEGLVAAARRANALDRHRIRARAQRELGVDRMVRAYEHALTEVGRSAVAGRQSSTTRGRQLADATLTSDAAK